MPSLLFLATTITILQLSASLPEPETGGSVLKPPVGSLGNLPGQLAQLFLWSMDNFDKKMAAGERYEQEEPLMPPALAARSSFEGSVGAHPVGNTANLPKWLVWQYLRLGWLGHQHPRVKQYTRSMAK